MEQTTQDKLEAALAALHKCREESLTGLFSLEVMHEIRNPLDALGNLLYLAGQETDLKVIHSLIRDAAEQITTLNQIAGQSLTLARVTQDGSPVNLLSLVDAAVKVHHRRISEKAVNVVRDFGQAESITVRAGEIVQVISNLVGNSLDALSQGGTIALRIRRRRLNICLLITDDGSGISPENSKRLFEPFFTTKADKGNGLGLALSKKILDRHQGTIRVRSSQNTKRRGTSFRICLPATV